MTDDDKAKSLRHPGEPSSAEYDQMRVEMFDFMLAFSVRLFDAGFTTQQVSTIMRLLSDTPIRPDDKWEAKHE